MDGGLEKAELAGARTRFLNVFGMRGLERACRLLTAAFGVDVCLVGSVLSRPT